MKKNNIKQDILKLKIQVKKIESIVDEFGESKNETSKCFFWAFLLLTPLHIICYILFPIFINPIERAISKPFELMKLTEKQKEHYKINGQFNEFEYMWGSIQKKHKDEE